VLGACELTSIPERFDPDQLDVTERQVQRRVNRIIGPVRVSAEDRAKFVRLVLINEVDLRLAKAIERGEVDEETKESVLAQLDAEVRAIHASLPPHLQRLAADTTVPEPVAGMSSSWTPEYVVFATDAKIRPAPPRRARVRERRPKRRTATRRARAPSRDPDEPAPPLGRLSPLDEWGGVVAAAVRMHAHVLRRAAAARVA
jgi:hypothetical protein